MNCKCHLHEALSCRLLAENEKNHKMLVRIFESLVVIRTWYFQKTRWKRYRLV